MTCDFCCGKSQDMAGALRILRGSIHTFIIERRANFQFEISELKSN